MNNYGLSDEELKTILDVFASYDKVGQVILYGSRAMGNNRPGSDIDMVIKGQDISFDDILNLSIELDELGMLYKFDLENYYAIEDQDVIDHINRVGKIL